MLSDERLTEIRKGVGHHETGQVSYELPAANGAKTIVTPLGAWIVRELLDHIDAMKCSATDRLAELERRAEAIDRRSDQILARAKAVEQRTDALLAEARQAAEELASPQADAVADFNTGPLYQSEFHAVADEVASMVAMKNRKYGNSALEPVRIFSKADTAEQLRVRIDDKLSRIRAGAADEDEDPIRDLMGYLILELVRRRRFPSVALGTKPDHRGPFAAPLASGL
jgi:hypothetical protein